MKKNTFLYIITFGIFYLVVKHKAKKIAKKESKEISTSNVINFDVKELLEELGNKENIVSVEASVSCVIVTLKDINKINLDNFNKFKTKGLFISDNKINLLFGNNSFEIKKELEKIL